jgi:uncharacterized membrane protein YbhN (UPF0104 family)
VNGAHPWRRRLALAARVAVAAALFIWLATQIDWRALGDTFAQVRWGLAALGLAVLWSGLAIAVVRWRRILHALGSPLGLGEIIRIFGSGLFLSLFLPTSIGGDVYRLARIGQGGFGVARAGVSLLAERGIGLVALILLAAPVVALHPLTRDLLPLAVALGAGGLGAILAVAFWGGPVAHLLARRLPALEPALGPASWSALMRQAPAVFGLSLLIHLSTVGANLLLAHALRVQLGWWQALALIPLIVLSGQLPISPGGLGVREAAFVYFLGRAGIAKEPAFAVGLAWLAGLYLTGAIGAVLFLLDRRSGAKAEPGAKADPGARLYDSSTGSGLPGVDTAGGAS